MKVMMATPYHPKDDGIAVHTAKLIAHLRNEADVEVEILTQRSVTSSEKSDEPSVFRCVSMNPLSVVRSVRAIRQSGADVVHVQYALPAQGPAVFYVMLAAWWVRRSSVLRLVVTCHEVRRELNVLRVAGVLIFRGIRMISDVVVVHTEESRALLEDRCAVAGRKIAYSPLGAERVARPDPQRIDDAMHRYCRDGRELVVFFGWIHPDKGIEDLIAATELLARTPGGVDKLEVLICGAVRPRTGLFRYFGKKDSEYEAHLRSMVRASSLESVVRFAGFVPDDDVVPLLSGARVMVVPYRNTTQSAVLNQAIAVGVPVVASNLPGLRETLERGGGVLVEPHEPAMLCDALQRIIEDDLWVDELRHRQVALQQEIGFERVVARLLAVYRFDAAILAVAS